MPDFSTNDVSSRFAPEEWMQDNDRGLALAADGDWGEACEAFAAAADRLARSQPSTRGSHEPMALILSNLAQANFRLGRVDEALQHAQRVCALRVAIAGEDAMPVVRARMDLAVMLASRGRLDEARTLVQRVIHAVEHRVGEDDARLVILLENAARIALAAGSPASAEPLLIRLHALLDAHDMSTGRAERLLARVAAVRSPQVRPDEAVTETAAAEAPAAEALVIEVLAGQTSAVSVAHEPPEQQTALGDALTPRVYAHAMINANDEWDDQPLRDAVAVTDILLRSTPSGVPIIPVSTPIEPPLLIADGTSDPADLPDPFDAFANFSFDLADVAPISVAPVDQAPVDGGLVLDFTVAHGVVDELDDAPMLQAPPVSLPIPNALPEMPAVVEPPTVSPEPTQIVSSGSTRGIAPMADMAGTAPPLPVPAPVAAPVASPAPTERPAPRADDSRNVMPPAAKGKPSPGKLIVIVAGALAAAGSAAAYFLLK